jgi:hypothetical protein
MYTCLLALLHIGCCSRCFIWCEPCEFDQVGGAPYVVELDGRGIQGGVQVLALSGDGVCLVLGYDGCCGWDAQGLLLSHLGIEIPGYNDAAVRL